MPAAHVPRPRPPHRTRLRGRPASRLHRRPGLPPQGRRRARRARRLFGHPPTPSREDLTRWWQKFDDPVLGQLVEQAAAANLDIAQAVARLRQAREALVQSRAVLLPTRQRLGRLSAQRERPRRRHDRSRCPTAPSSTPAAAARNSFSLGADASYQVDLFGEVRRTVEASRARLRGVRLRLRHRADLGRRARSRATTSSRGSSQAQLANARASRSAIQDDNLEIAGFRVQAGLVSVARRRTGARAARADRRDDPALEAAATTAAVVAARRADRPGAGRAQGRAGGARSRSRPARPRSRVGIPADTLRQRPDVRAAERKLAAATAQIGVAKAQLYPALAITGNIDTNAARDRRHLVDAITGGLFAGLTQTIFDGGRLRSQVRAQRGRRRRRVRRLQVDRADRARGCRERRRRAADRAGARARSSRSRSTPSNNSAILGAQPVSHRPDRFHHAQPAGNARCSPRATALTQARADQATALIQLYLALGGGWDSHRRSRKRPDTPTRRHADGRRNDSTISSA